MGQGWSLTPLRIAAIYAFFSALYILFSDRIILAFISDSEQITLLQGLKGLAFITISAWIIYTLVTRYATDLSHANQELKDTQQRYRTTIDALKDGIIVLDREQKCRICNAVLRRWHGYETGPEELVGRRIAEIFPGPQSFDPTDIDDVFASGTPLIRSLPIDIAQRTFPAQIRIIPVLEGQTVTHAVIVVRDLTEHVRLEDLKKETFQAIERFTVQFAVLNDQIRNPLQIILGLVELDGGPNSREIARQVDEIDGIVKQLDQGWIESAKIKAFLQKHYGK